jgi:hypothetical protein
LVGGHFCFKITKQCPVVLITFCGSKGKPYISSDVVAWHALAVEIRFQLGRIDGDLRYLPATFTS